MKPLIFGAAESRSSAGGGGAPRAFDFLALQRFVHGQPRRGALYGEFLAIPGVPEHLDSMRPSIYEFSWGFVAETQLDEGGRVWDMHVRQVWRDPVRRAIGALEAAQRELVLPELLRQRRADGPGSSITFPPSGDGLGCGSYASLQDAARARIWMGEKLLAQLWPAVMHSVA